MPNPLADSAVLRRVRGAWRTWSELDPFAREYECERAVRGIALGVVGSLAVWAALWLVLWMRS